LSSRPAEVLGALSFLSCPSRGTEAGRKFAADFRDLVRFP
jgi:hypothetical protein